MKRKCSCEKCRSKDRPSKHHVLPKCFFGGAGGICYLCIPCHRELEMKITVAERLANGNKPQRHKLPAHEYVEILNKFLFP